MLIACTVPGLALADQVPACDAEGLRLTADGGHQDCGLVVEIGEGRWSFTFGFELADGGERVTVQVSDPDGGLETFEAMGGNSFAYPEVRDLDGDGMMEILIPDISGAANTAAHLYARGADGPYALAGDILMSAVPVGDGLIRTWAHGGCCSGAESYWRLEGGQLAPAFSVAFSAATDGQTDAGTLCEIEDSGGLATLGLDMAAARAAYCPRNPFLEN